MIKVMALSKDIKISHISVLFTLGILFWFLFPVPKELSIQAYHLLIIFVLTMVGIMFEVIPMCGTLFVSLLISSLTGTIDLKTNGFSGFMNMVPWLIFFILALSKSITQSTIGLRVAYFFMKLFGKNIIGLAYSISVTELTLATILPSNTARAASVGFPIVTSLSKYIGTTFKEASRGIGSFLTLVYTSSNALCSGMFLTAMISNAIIVDVADRNGVHLSWLTWVRYIAIPAGIILLVMPIILYVLLKPQNVDMNKIRQDASKKTQELGPFSKEEKIILYAFLGMLFMWIFADLTHISIMTTILLGISVFLFLGIFTVKDILSDYSTLNSVITIGILISYANCLGKYGAIDWLNNNVQNFVSIYPENMRLYALSIIYFFTHYFFSGEGSKIVALNLPFVLTGVALGIDKLDLIITLAAFSSFSTMLTHYANPAVIMMFSNGYVTAKKWMGIGLIISIITMTMWFILRNITL
ncbi:MAG: anion permease [Holosporales bacterium]|jgi:DASS family divalent anion:Na+ symporter|nr:anion permease [Holosporales bacterium]